MVDFERVCGGRGVHGTQFEGGDQVDVLLWSTASAAAWLCLRFSDIGGVSGRDGVDMIVWRRPGMRLVSELFNLVMSLGTDEGS